MAEVLLVGSLTRDGLRLPFARWTQPGGSPWHAGLALADAGADVAIVARAGPWARAFAAPALRAAGATVWLAPSAADTAFLNDYRTDRRWQWLRSNAGALGAPDVPEELPPVASMALSPLLPDGLSLAALSRLRGAGGFRGLDVQGLLRRIGPRGRIETVARDVSAWAEAVHALKFSAREFAVVFAGMEEAEAATTLARDLAVEVIVTHGDAGALVATPRGPAVREPGGSEAPHQADTTGGGDIFLATYVRARARGLEAPAAMADAIALAGAVVARRAGLFRGGPEAIVGPLRGLTATALWAWRWSVWDVPTTPRVFAGDGSAARALAARFGGPLVTEAMEQAGPAARGPAWAGAAWALASIGWPGPEEPALRADGLAAWAELERTRAQRLRRALLA